MRASRTAPPGRILARHELFRLMTMIGMLVVICMFIVRFREMGRAGGKEGDGDDDAVAAAAGRASAAPKPAEATKDEPAASSPGPSAEAQRGASAAAKEPSGAAAKEPAGATANGPSGATANGPSGATANEPSGATDEPAPSPPAPSSTSPARTATDEDPAQRALAAKELAAVSDGTLALTPAEIPAYDRLLCWASEQTLARLSQREAEERQQRRSAGLPDPGYASLVRAPRAQRGKLIEVILDVQRIEPSRAADKELRVYQMFGTSGGVAGDPWLAVLVAPPQGVSAAASAGTQPVRVVGYFLKVQSAPPAGAAEEKQPTLMPMLIGRAVAVPNAVAGRPSWFRAPAPPPALTDEDPKELEAAKREFAAVDDGDLRLQPTDQPAFDRLIAWAQRQDSAKLFQRAARQRQARKDQGLSPITFRELIRSPQDYRGELLWLRFHVRLVQTSKTEEGLPLYYFWGNSQETDWPMVLVSVDWPEGFPAPHVPGSAKQLKYAEAIRFAGYFLRNQGYHPVKSKPGDSRLLAPMLVGRVEWVRGEPAGDSGSWTPLWIALLAVMGLGLAVKVVLLFRPARRRPAAGASAVYQAGRRIAPEDWLGDPTSVEIPEGNNPPVPSESPQGAREGNGQGPDGLEGLPKRLDRGGGESAD